MCLFRTLTTALLALTPALAFPVRSLTTGASTDITVDRLTWASDGTQIVGYHYHRTLNSRSPAVLIAHGLGGLQTSRLQGFAEQFAAAGYQAFTFDYRYWGQSAGTPRNIIDIASQQDDYRAAVSFVNTLPSTDGRIVLWGSSLSGGHVITLGATDIPGLAAVLAMVPHTNGNATMGALPPASLPGLIAAGLEDSTAGLVDPLYIPLANYTGEFGALTQEGALAGYQFVQPTSPPPGNVFPARFVITLPFYFPDSIAKGNAPYFIGVGMTDNIVTPEPAVRLAERIGAELKEYEGGHFSVYPGADRYEALQRDELEFLAKHVPLN